MKNSLFFTDREANESYSLSNQFAEHLEFILVKTRQTVTNNDMYYALSLSIRDRLVRNWLRTQHAYNTKDVKMAGNGYYDETMKRLHDTKLGERELKQYLEDDKITVKELGGWECAKCHY